MTDTNHPITPPPELVQQWLEEYYGTRRTGEVNAVEQHLATQAANWGADQQLKLDAERINQSWQKGADQELEACCEWLRHGLPYESHADYLRDARRPKPPSLKEEVKQIVDCLIEGDCLNDEDVLTLRRALESLPD